jgi:hypothetical protein
MKKSIILTGFLSILSLTIVIGCETKKQRTENAEVNLTHASTELSDVKVDEIKDSLKLASVEE